MSEPFRFGTAEIDPLRRTVSVDGAPGAIGARAFDVLMALLERRERVVAKDELIELVWPGVVVEDNNLQVQISALRKLLGAGAIATVPGRGYRFTLAPPPEAAPAPASAAAPSDRRLTNLPTSRSRFIGREEALADSARLLADSRLITFSGIGGCGKTRLAVEVARRQLAGQADGVWFVDLASLQDGARVVDAVAGALEVRQVEGTPLLAALAAHVATRQMLLVLDNCEHVIDAVVAVIDALLVDGVDLRILATSREAFGIAGEQIYPVRSLRLPAAAADFAAVREAESVRVFVDRARLVIPGFALDEQNAQTVAEICRRLDGIVLAIELAASRVALLSVEEIRARLDDRFRLLTGGGRALPRHQTLQATMHWSYEHLSAPEQELFRRLSVFAGGCTLAGAAGVAGSGDEYAMLALLTALHDKSLLTVDRDGHALPRYRMLETVRQYAEERLAESGEGDAIRSRHLHYFIALAEAIEPHYLDGRQGATIALQRAEQENLLAACAWCEHDSEGAALGLRLAAASWRYWRSSDQFKRGHDLGRAALDRAGPDGEPLATCRLLIGVATLAYYMGRYDESKVHAARALAIARSAGELAQVANALVLMTFSKTPEQDPLPVLESYEEIHRIATALGDRSLVARNLNNRAEWHRMCGATAEAGACYEEALAVQRELENPGNRAVVLCNYVRLLLSLGDVARAAPLLGEVFALTRTHGLRGMDKHVLEVGAALAAARGEPERAARLHGAALRRMRDGGARRESVDEAFLAPILAAARTVLGDPAFAAAERSGEALAHDVSLDELGTWLAQRGDL